MLGGAQDYWITGFTELRLERWCGPRVPSYSAVPRNTDSRLFRIVAAVSSMRRPTCFLCVHVSARRRSAFGSLANGPLRAAGGPPSGPPPFLVEKIKLRAGPGEPGGGPPEPPKTLRNHKNHQANHVLVDPPGPGFEGFWAKAEGKNPRMHKWRPHVECQDLRSIADVALLWAFSMRTAVLDGSSVEALLPRWE